MPPITCFLPKPGMEPMIPEGPCAPGKRVQNPWQSVCPILFQELLLLPAIPLTQVPEVPVVQPKHPAVLVTPCCPTPWDSSVWGFFSSLPLNQTNQPKAETSFVFSKCSFCMCEVEHSGTEKRHIYGCPCHFSCIFHACALQWSGLAGRSQASHLWSPSVQKKGPTLGASRGNVASEMGACRGSLLNLAGNEGEMARNLLSCPS